MSNPITNVPVKMPDTYTESIPIINDNFDKLINQVSDLQPRTFSTANTGARPAQNSMLVVEALAFDREEYENFATLTDQYDVYVDSGTNATGTIAIDNTAGSGTWVVSVGDYYTFNPIDADTGYPDVPRMYVATSATSVVAGATGSATMVAERCGTRYNTATVSAIPVSIDPTGNPYINYTGYNGEFSNLVKTLLRPVSITPVPAGGGGGGGTTWTITASGGAGVENDPNYMWPNGASLSSAQKNIVVQHHLNITTTFESGVGGFTVQSTAPYTKNFATSTIRCINHDSSPHSIYVYLTGTIFSGITGNIFK